MSSRSANFYGNSRDNATRGAQSAAFGAITNCPTYSIDRFVLGQPHSRPPPGLSHTEAKVKAVAESEARASAMIREFDTRFDNAR
ncbi:hypothetical protein TgHK011_003598 [Trichoderma gracile]|nr:hypothetical protein TgHK011_003598 [Trichoderma gracile]